MEADGLHEGDLLDIRSAHGKIVGVAASDDSVRRGVLSMAHLWGSIDPQEDPDGTMGAHTGRLVSLASGAQTINHMPILTGIPVDISRR